MSDWILIREIESVIKSCGSIARQKKDDGKIERRLQEATQHLVAGQLEKAVAIVEALVPQLVES